MKIKPQKYALALLELLEKDENRAEEIISSFVKSLAKNKHLSLAQKIIEEFSSAFDIRSKQLKAEVISARALNEKTLKEIKEFILQKTAAHKADLKNRVDKDILGGFILKYRDEILDASLRTKLENLKNKMRN